MQLQQALDSLDCTEIVSGGARGADSFGERVANRRGYKLTIFKAKWGELGKQAGILRNIEMAEYADALIAFWDGGSRGTKHMIREAGKKKLPVIIIKY